MARYSRLLWLAYKKTHLSEHRIPVSAMVVKGNRVLSFGVNGYKTHTRQAIVYGNRRHIQYIHAELDALIGLSKETLDNSSLYICRRLKNGETGICLPCSACMKVIIASNISTIIYSTYGIPDKDSDDWFEVLTV